jgi:hypothetical protein
MCASGVHREVPTQLNVTHAGPCLRHAKATAETDAFKGPIGDGLTACARSKARKLFAF